MVHRFWILIGQDFSRPIGGIKQIFRLAEALISLGYDCQIVQGTSDFFPSWFKSSIPLSFCSFQLRFFEARTTRSLSSSVILRCVALSPPEKREEKRRSQSPGELGSLWYSNHHLLLLLLPPPPLDQHYRRKKGRGRTHHRAGPSLSLLLLRAATTTTTSSHYYLPPFLWRPSCAFEERSGFERRGSQKFRTNEP